MSGRGAETGEGAEASAPVSIPPMGLRSWADIHADLRAPLPPAVIRQRRQGGAVLDYIEWHTVVRVLDRYAPSWTCEVRSTAAVGDLCVVVVRITIPTADGPVWREATGSERLDTTGYGDPSSCAEAMAYKRAAAKLGIGLDLYRPKDGAP